MPGFFHFLRCLGKALVKHGPRALAGLVPMGAELYDATRDVLSNYGGKNKDNDLRADVQATAQAGPAEVKQAAETIVREVAADQPAEVQAALAAYLTQVPAAMRRSLRREADPSGKIVPATMALRRPEDLLPLLPTQLPRFKPGDRPLPGVDRELVELLGSGGFGEVWKARNPHRPSVPPVALKFCLDLDPMAKKAIENELRLLVQLEERGWPAGLVRLHETHLSATLPCLEYEYVAGGDLAGLVRERHEAGGMKAKEAARLMLQIAEAVAFAHERGIVHRDLKPANILVERTGKGELRLKVADFGIGGVAAGRALAQAGGRQHTSHQDMTQALHGAYSPLYASIQQMRGEPPNVRDDVYALGVIWYQLLTGDLTTGAPSGDSWKDDLGRAGVPREHVALMTVCFETKPAARPADAADLAKRLQMLLAPTVLPVRPKSRSVPIVAWAAAAVVLLCVVVGVVAWSLSGPGTDTARRPEAKDTSNAPIDSPKPTKKELPAGGSSRRGGDEAEVELVPGVKMMFNWVPPGEAQLGSPRAERLEVMKNGGYMEEPDWLKLEAEEVRGTYTEKKGFWLAKYPVTQEQWKALMGNDKHSFFSADGGGKEKVKGIPTSRFPMEDVSWNDSQDFLKKMNMNASVKVPATMGKGTFVLPHENEWEYAVRGGQGNQQAFYFGNALNGDLANCDGTVPFGPKDPGDYKKRTTEAGEYEGKAPHTWKLCDMCGNVWQWCDDLYTQGGTARVVRGGSWYLNAWYCRSAIRSWGELGSYVVGFRVCFRLD